jgi:hypothetical protein
MGFAIPMLPKAMGARPPNTEEERRKLRALDEEAFSSCERTYYRTSVNRDPAYLKFAVQRMFFYSFCKFHTSTYCI